MIVKAIALCACLIGLGVGIASAADIKTFCSIKGCDKELKDILEVAPLKVVDTQQTFELSGIKLGDAFESSKAKIKNINPQYDISSKDSVVLGIVGKRPNSTDEFDIAEDGNGKVWLVQRYQILKGGNEIKIDTFLDTVFKKYGQPSEEGIDGFTWHYDRDGKQIFPKAQFKKQVCSGAQVGVFGILPTLSDTCGKVIRMSYKTSSGFVTMFSIGMADHKSMYDQKNAKQIKPSL